MNNKNTFNRLTKNYILLHKLSILFALIMMIIAAGTTGLHAWLVRPALDEVLINGNKQMLLLIPIAIVITTFIKGISTYLHFVTMSKVAFNIISNLQSEMFNKLMFFNLKFYSESKTGNLISRLINDTNFLRLAIVKSITGIIKEPLIIVFLIGNMIYQSWELTLFVIFAFPMALWPIRKIGKSIRKLTYAIQNEISSFSNVLGESIKGIRQVKAFNQEDYEINKANSTITKIKNYFIKSAKISNRLSPLMEFIGSLAIALSIYIGGIFVLNETMTAGQFMSFLVSLLLAYKPIKSLGNINLSIQEGLSGAERIFELLDTKDIHLEKDTNTNTIKIIDGKIEFKNISFAYSSKNVLEKIDLDIPSGKKTALVGLSGSGKSTIINLILRFFDPHQGKILIDNQDISKCSLKSLRKNISLVTQETNLFNDSIEANIKYAKLNATKEEVYKVTEEAGAIDFIKSLPEGINTIIGESGIKLSGGQRQRIAIARALLKNAPILLLDEATSSLDNITEFEVQESISNLMKNKTSLIIAHRLTTIEDSDLIYLIKNGKVIGKGTHKELIKDSSFYSQMYYKESYSE
tara:strand:+ start:123 stop:1859 length:1737 start_codon:yes stop_codon:yes gene_type:complete